MADSTAISWCDATMNPWTGCSKVSPGCESCYAETWSKRAGAKVGKWGPGAPRVRTSDAIWRAPYAWNSTPFYQCLDCGARFAPPTKRLREGWVTCPGCGKHEGRMVDDEADGANVKQVRRRVFCASLADVFDNEVPIEWRVDLLFLIEQTPNLDWLLLTKRIGNVQRMVAETSEYLAMVHRPLAWPLPNVWLGATIVNQEEADRDIPKLLATPARVRFLSMEPLLAPVDLSPSGGVRVECGNSDPIGRIINQREAFPDGDPDGQIDWVIVGGESGHGARPFAVEWARDIVRQCRAAGVAVHVKQLGAHTVTTGITGPGEHWPEGTKLEDTGEGRFCVRLPAKGGDWATWPEDLRVREFPACRS